jgi:mannose-6-phosphate isomerase-like protein (cupin superfamily)
MSDVPVLTATTVGRASIRRLTDQDEFRSTCGMRRNLLDAGESDPVRIHYLRIGDSRKHVHRKTIEYYYVTEGAGEIELDDEVVPITKGDLVVVPPGVWHTSRPFPGHELHVLLVVVPPRDADGRPDHDTPDEHYD